MVLEKLRLGASSALTPLGGRRYTHGRRATSDLSRVVSSPVLLTDRRYRDEKREKIGGNQQNTPSRRQYRNLDGPSDLHPASRVAGRRPRAVRS